jgi:hypothetical protein
MFRGNLDWFLKNRKDLTRDVVHTVEQESGEVTHVLTIVDREQLCRLMVRLLEPNEFLSDYGIRSLSRSHLEHPFIFDGEAVGYEPAESASKLKGGNSNWRGPIWFPTCFLLIESLRKLGKAYGPNFRVPAPWLKNQSVTFPEVAREIANRLIKIFVRNGQGLRPVFGGAHLFQNDPHWRDYLLFYEYFHGDNGAGLGASHQTGWTGLVASLIDEWRN